MAEKFEKLLGNFKIVMNGKDYPFTLSIRQRGAYENLRMKFDNEAIILFLFERFKEGFLKAQESLGKPASVGELEEYEKELSGLFLKHYDKVITEVAIELGITSREEVDAMKRRIQDEDFLLSGVIKKMEAQTK
jgi:hypothetical protein